MYCFDHLQDVIIGDAIYFPGHGVNVVNGINAIDKSFLIDIMNKIQLHGIQEYYYRIAAGFFTADRYVGLENNLIEFLYHFPSKNVVIY